MSTPTLTKPILSRRRFLQYAAMGSGVAVLAACTALPAAPAATTAPPASEPAAAAVDDDVQVMAKDVIDYMLESDEWAGPYGQATFRIHEAAYNDEPAYYIRTDASDPDFASQVGLVYVPLLNVAANMDNVNMLYDFGDDRPAVIKYAPGDDFYGSLFKFVPVTVNDDSLDLTSADAIEAAAADGGVTLEERNLFVNYPVVKWPGGEMSVDPDLEGILPGGQLFEPVDTGEMTVKFKLHQCFPGSRYILTDTGAAPMAPMMNILAAPPTQQLKELGGTDEIWVFGNGIPGPGVMGFQPAVFDNKAGQPAWSPFWDHFTLLWKDESKARVLTNSAEIRELVAAGELEQFNGVPDSHPNGFVVNCPAPILAPNTFTG